jgi:hypothetical protein
MMRFLSWSNLWLALSFKLTGSIPWLIIVPILAVILEFVDLRFKFEAKLPISLSLMFAIALVFGAAYIAYALCCPREIKKVGSEEDWKKRSADRRRELINALNQDRLLADSLISHIKESIVEKLENVPGKGGFSQDQIKVISFHLIEAVKGGTDLTRQYVEDIADTKVVNFNTLNVSRTPARIVCALLIGVAFALVAIQIVLRIMSVWHATAWG